MDRVYSSIFRQAALSRFEIELHKLVGERATAEEIHDAYFKIQKEMFGPNIDVNPDMRYDWLRVHHFLHYPFYLYNYVFGKLLGAGLFRLYKTAGPEAVMPVFRAGGNEDPVKLLAAHGMDLTSRSFWNSCMLIFCHRFDRWRPLAEAHSAER